MDDLNMFIARTQARMAFFLLVILVILVFAVLAVLLLPLNLNGTVTNLLVQVITGVLSLCAMAVGFFYARMRSSGIPDSTQIVTQSHTSPDGSVTKITSPASIPVPVSVSSAAPAPLPPSPEKSP